MYGKVALDVGLTGTASLRETTSVGGFFFPEPLMTGALHFSGGWACEDWPIGGTVLETGALEISCLASAAVSML